MREGLVVLVPSPVGGLDLAHVPPHTWLLDLPSLLCYLLGLWSLADRDGPAGAARTPADRALWWWWWLLVAPLLLAEVPVRDSPSLHPAVAAFPCYLLVCGRGLTCAARLLGRYRVALVVLVLWSVLTNLWTYAGWVNSPPARQARHEVGVAPCLPTAHPVQQPCRGAQIGAPARRATRQQAAGVSGRLLPHI